MAKHKVPIQSLIDHIKTSMDVDPWAKEMAEELLSEQQEIVLCKDCKHYDETQKGQPREKNRHYVCDDFNPKDNWFCADGERKDNDA